MVYARQSIIDGTGLFASQRIPAGTRILQYLGERIGKAEASRRCEAGNHFIFTLDDDWDIDGNVPQNLARFANHSCTPNSESIIEGPEVWVIAIRDIAPDEEITYNYGYDLEAYRDYACRCGSANCVGYMVAEEFFEHVRANAVR
ncbi:MAG TPA: SET domain-containing protein-lysine N-methyltransferase [Verrucomicrobiae bacterium]|nr:SET domain-containing protein-lysine N-methyltransferase [Verrucomicrobiae bacterium]